MRGKVRYVPAGNAYLRITPAYAGKSGFSVAKGAIAEDHPRLCGEKFVRVALLARIVGSPPPMRGKVHKIQAYDLYNRITPAYAGKSFRPRTVMQ